MVSLRIGHSFGKLDCELTELQMFGRIHTSPETDLRAFSGTSPIAATQHFRKTRRDSQASLIGCSDGALYVLKMTGNPHEPNRLANELLGTVLCEAVGLPVPTVVPIKVTKEFLNQSPKLDFGTTNGNYSPEPGQHLGSRFLGEAGNTSRLLQILAPSHIMRVTNRDAFLGMYLLDLAANHRGSRQALFVREQEVLNLRAVFVDHGSMFGGPAWDGVDNKCLPLYCDNAIYTGLWDEGEVCAWVTNLRKSVPSKLSEAVSCVPKSWFNGDLTDVADSIMRRLDRLPELAYEYRLSESYRLRPSRPGAALHRCSI